MDHQIIGRRDEPAAPRQTRSGQPPGRGIRLTTALMTVAILMFGLGTLGAVGARAAGSTIVSLTFDNDTLSAYNLGFAQALQPQGVHATFYVNSGTVGSASGFMSWADLSALAAANDEIGGKTVDGADLTTDPNATSDICNDRQNLIAHGITPYTFAYPDGDYNSTTESEVEGCGYGNARSGGSLSPSGGTYADSLPPHDWMAVYAYAPQQVTLANLEALVTAAANAGGGWVPIVIQNVCSQADDAADYSACTASWGYIELADLQSFVSWMQAAGTTGAPSGAVFQTMGRTATQNDTSAPTTTALCNGAACQTATYDGTVDVTLQATDLGSGVASTHYTTDGTTPTQASPLYTGPIPLTASTTLKYASWDNVGNQETAHTLSLTIQEPSNNGIPPTTSISCNGAACSTAAYNGQVAVTLTAVDNSGWGIADTYYTTDDTTPTSASTIYTGPFTLTQPSPATPAYEYVVEFYSVDLAGNVGAVTTQDILVGPSRTVVSLTFDDGYLSTYNYGVPLLLSHNMTATFYMIDPSNTDDEQLTYAQILTLYKDGFDIGGHTVNHEDLTVELADDGTAVTTADVCTERNDLIASGVPDPTSFAYPDGAYTAAVEAIVKSCGFEDARTAGNLSMSVTTPTAPWAGSIPPADPYAIPAVDVDQPAMKSLNDLEAFVNAAVANGGGWVPLIFHEICPTADPSYEDCNTDTASTMQDVFGQFLDWLNAAGQPGGAPVGVVVKDVAQVMNSSNTTPPVTSIQCNSATCQTAVYTGPVTVSLSATDSGGSGVKATYYTTDGSTPTPTSTLYTAPFVISATSTIKFFSVDNAGNQEPYQSQLITIATAAPPTTTIACNGAACSSGWYNAAVTVSLTPVSNSGSPIAETYYTTDGTTPTTSSSVYTVLFTVSQSSTVKFFSVDTAGNSESVKSQTIQVDTGAPTTTIACNGATCSSGWYTASVTGTLSATASSGGSPVTATYYTTDNTTPTASSSVYSGAFTVSQSSTVQYFSVNAAGNAEPVKSELVQVDGVPPTTTIACSGTACSSGWYSASVTATLTAADNSGGSGVKAIYYTTNGTTPTTSSTVYQASFTVAKTSTIKFFSIDVAGNKEAVKSELIQIDTSAPTATITCNSAACATGWYGVSPVTITLTATDNSGGSGVKAIYYTTNGSTPTTSSTVYSGPFPVSATSTVKFFAVDNAGNGGAVKSQIVQIDTIAPTTSVLCNGGTCSTGWYSTSPVSVTLTATDNSGGSGVKASYYTTNGATPTTSSSVYSRAFSVSGTSTVKFFSVDNAGNREAVKSALIQIDRTAPTTSIACNGGACSAGTYTAPVTVSLTATDNSGGSGVKATYYTTNGATPATSSTVYGGAFTISVTSTIRFFSVDNAGNSETARSQKVTIAGDPPAATSTVPVTGGGPGGSAPSTRGAVPARSVPLIGLGMALVLCGLFAIGMVFRGRRRVSG